MIKMMISLLSKLNWFIQDYDSDNDKPELIRVSVVCIL